jgi:hypothetical protein
MISLATPRQIAGRIASMHNGRCCRHCRRPVAGGVFSFGMSGSDPRWFASIEEAQTAAPGPRLFFPIGEQDVTRADVEGWLAEHQEEVDGMVERAWQEREERKRQRELREATRGFVTSIPCFSCGKPKDRPSDECYFCGDVPTQHNSSPAEIAAFNREYGAAA